MQKHLTLLIVLGSLNIGGVDAQASFFTHLGAHAPDNVVLTCEWDSLLRLKDNTAWDAQLKIAHHDSIETWKLELTARGKYRRAKCSFPPMEINLKKGALRQQGLLEFDKLKLVTHCNEENTDPSDLYEELLIYQLYNLLTPYSFNVLLLRIDYRYPDGKTFLKNAPALILEPTAELKYRVGGQELEVYGVAADSLDAASYCRNALFQFMIGNFDWDLTMQQNVKMIGERGNYHVVPYDFDFSCIVSPAYARIPSDYAIKDFRDRIYKGQYFSEYLPLTIREFLEKKELILTHVDNFTELSKSRRREIVKYLDQFFEFIEDPNCQITQGMILPYQDK